MRAARILDPLEASPYYPRVSLRRVVLAGFLGLLGAWPTTPAIAQQPVCRPLAPGEAAIRSCRPPCLDAAVRLLADFSVDQIFKPAPPTFGRNPLDLAQALVGKELRDNPQLAAFLASLPSLRFRQLDRVTGTLVAEFPESRRVFETRLEGVPGEPTLAIKFPEHMEGGYWRAPDALQIAFWEGKRMDARLASATGATLEGTLQCLALSPDGLLLRMGPGDKPPIFFAFRECTP